MPRTQILAALSNWLAFAATLVVAFFLTPFLIRHLGTEPYGIWCVAEAVLAYFTLLDMGLAACLVRGVARHKALEDFTNLNQLASACLALFLLAGLIALVIGVPVMLALSDRLGHLAFLLVMLVNLAMTLPLAIFPSILDGLERYAVKSAVRIVFLIARTAAIVTVVRHDADLLGLAVIFTVSLLVEHAVMAGLVYRFLPSLRLRVTAINRTALREIRRFSVDAFLAMLAGRITTQTSVIVVGLLLPLPMVAIFATASRLVEYARTLLRTITATLTPGVSAMEARGDWAGIRGLYLAATRWVLYLVLPIQMGLVFFGEVFLIRWVPEIGDAGATTLFILSLALTPSVAQSVASRVLYGLGRLRFFARLTLAEAAMNLVLLFTLIPIAGLSGVALAITLPNIAASLMIIHHANRMIALEAPRYLSVWRRPLLAGIVPGVIWWILPAPAAAWDHIFGTITLGLVPYAAVVAFLESPRRAISHREGRHSWRILAARWARFGPRTVPSSDPR